MQLSIFFHSSTDEPPASIDSLNIISLLLLYVKQKRKVFLKVFEKNPRNASFAFRGSLRAYARNNIIKKISSLPDTSRTKKRNARQNRAPSGVLFYKRLKSGTHLFKRLARRLFVLGAHGIVDLQFGFRSAGTHADKASVFQFVIHRVCLGNV